MSNSVNKIIQKLFSFIMNNSGNNCDNIFMQYFNFKYLCSFHTNTIPVLDNRIGMVALNFKNNRVGMVTLNFKNNTALSLIAILS